MENELSPEEVSVIVIPAKRIISVNEYLLPGIIKKKVWNKEKKKYEVKHIPRLYKSPETTQYQEWLIKELKKAVTSEEKVKIRNFGRYQLKIEAIFRKSYEERDCDNIIKSTQDALFNMFLRIDDKFIRSVTCEKYYNPENSNEYLIITISKSKVNKKKFS